MPSPLRLGQALPGGTEYWQLIQPDEGVNAVPPQSYLARKGPILKTTDKVPDMRCVSSTPPLSAAENFNRAFRFYQSVCK